MPQKVPMPNSKCISPIVKKPLTPCQGTFRGTIFRHRTWSEAYPHTFQGTICRRPHASPSCCPSRDGIDHRRNQCLRPHICLRCVSMITRRDCDGDLPASHLPSSRPVSPPSYLPGDQLPSSSRFSFPPGYLPGYHLPSSYLV